MAYSAHAAVWRFNALFSASNSARRSRSGSTSASTSFFRKLRLNVLSVIDVACFDMKADGPFRFSLVARTSEVLHEARITTDNLGRSPNFDPGLAGVVHEK